MLYPRSREKELAEELFGNPTKEFRGAPFWAWNKKLNREELESQVHQFREMGMGGFHVHCRVGLDTEYLGDEFFDCVRGVSEKASKEDLLCYLYDEDRWPSGYAGGLVTKEKKYRTRFLVFSPVGYQDEEAQTYMAAAKAVRSRERTHLGYYRVVLDENGYLDSYEVLENIDSMEMERKDDGRTERLWEAYLEISGNTPWFNDQAYVNTLDPAALKRFLEVTHEKYYEEFGDQFGKEMKTIFTDEPQTTHKGMLRGPFDCEPIITPYTDDLEGTFREKYGYSLIARLPEIFWERKDRDGYRVRYHYHAHVTERFAEAFGDQIGEWCDAHGIGLTGHMLNEWTLYSQTLGVGECMRTMKGFAVPGVDMLCDRREYSTVKQAQSLAHQCGREGVMCEIYGVTGWDFDFRNHKIAGDWQAALGVTLRVPHLTWVSMEGEGKRDYPACIGRHSPWYREYHMVEDHFARLNTAMTRGRAMVKVGVIHPVESYWMLWGNKAQTSLVRQVLEENFSNIIEWLLFGMIDFDFISEGLLEDCGSVTDSAVFAMGEMAYETVIVPECCTLRENTLKNLEAFQANGGSVIFLGDAPSYVEAKKDSRVKKLAEKCTCLPFNRARLLEELEKYRVVDVDSYPVDGVDPARMKHSESGNRANNVFYQMREDGEDRWLFLCHVNKPANEHITYTEQWDITIRGEYAPVCYDTLSGEITPLAASYRNGNTMLTYYTSQHGSLLLKLLPGRQTSEQAVTLSPVLPEDFRYVPEPESFSLEEENVLLLDQAEYAFDDGQWNGCEEILRIDNLFREKLGYPLRMEALAQPWVQKEEEGKQHCLRLRFRIRSEIQRDAVYFAMEHPENAQIVWNGRKVSGDDCGFFVDEVLRKVKLSGLQEGINTLELQIGFGRKTNVEWMYLLGDFGVTVCGKAAKITEMPRQIFYGDIVSQGLAFYAGNLEYHTEIETQEGELYIEASHYRGALIKVTVDSDKEGYIFLAPYRISLGHVDAGKHWVTFKIYGNRINAFGAVHNANAIEPWYGPNLWRTEGNKWSYEYQLKETGILTSPIYWVRKEN